MSEGAVDPRLAALHEKIRVCRSALQSPEPIPERVDLLKTLADTLSKEHQVSYSIENIEEAITIYEEVLQLRPSNHPQHTEALCDLGGTLERFCVHHGEDKPWARGQRCIQLLRESLELRSPGHPLRDESLQVLAKALFTVQHSEDTSGNLQLVTESVNLNREALQLRPVGHPERLNSLQCLSLLLRELYELSGDQGTLKEVIGSLAARFDLHGGVEDLLEAISLRRQALQLRSTGNARRPQTLQRLAKLLCRPGFQSWSEALILFREALDLCPSGFPNRATLLSDTSRCFLDPSSQAFDLLEGIPLLLEAHSDQFCHVNVRLKSAVSDLRLVENAYSAIEGTLNATDGHHMAGRILDLYIAVIGLLPCAANFGLNHDTRLQAVAGSDEIVRNAVARAVRFERASQAVEILEQGRGVFWSQTHHLRAAGLDGIPDKDRQELERLLHLLEFSARKAHDSDQTIVQREADAEARRRLNQQAEALIAKIRGYPGLGRFLLPASFEGLVGALPDGYVVILNASKLGHHALLLHRSAEVAASFELHPPQTGFDSTSVRAGLPRDLNGDVTHFDGHEKRAMRLDGGRQSSLDDVLALLWTSIVLPVLLKLGLQKQKGRDRPRVWWCVTGELGFLPVHASGTYRGNSPDCLANYAVCSYIPTLSSLGKARRDWQSISRTQLAGLIICEEASDDRRLPHALREVTLVRKCFESASASVLNTSSAHTSVVQLRTALEHSPAHILHLACHGLQDSEPLKSALQLYDGKLAIEDIMQLDLPHAVLAYLSACQTAKGDRNAPDQVVHLAASMLFCGFRSVIGTMWLMHDEDGPTLAHRFYEALLKREHVDLDDIAYALDGAIQSLRSQGVPARRWAPYMHIWEAEYGSLMDYHAC